MKLIGITGKSGSGKSTLAQLLAQKLQGICINIDKIGHKATSDEKITKTLCDTFGNQILDVGGKVNRKKLGNIVFEDKEKMDLLTDITWGYMQEVLDKIIKKESKPVIILEWALLPISKYWEKCEIKILMEADDIERKNKVIQRDKISEEYFLKRESGGIDYTNFTFDYICKNDYQTKTMKKIADKIK